MPRVFEDMAIEFVADFSLENIDNALTQVTSRQSELAAVENGLSLNLPILALRNEDNQVANSRIKDTDIAQAVPEKTKADIMSQVQISLQSQSNASSKYVLKLLQSQ
jgi:flagellin-like hook-associated protein FlgL